MNENTILKLAELINLKKALDGKYSVNFKILSALRGDTTSVSVTHSEYLREIYLKKIEDDIKEIHEGRIIY